jgi:hypothetical protein
VIVFLFVSPGDVPSPRPTLLKDTLSNFRTYLTARVYGHLQKCRAPCKLPIDLGRADKQSRRDSEAKSPSTKSVDGKIHQRALHSSALQTCCLDPFAWDGITDLCVSIFLFASISHLVLYAVRCLPPVEGVSWWRRVVKDSEGPDSDCGPIDFGPEVVGIPANLKEDILPWDAKILPVTIRVLRLLAHNQKSGVLVAGDKESVPGLKLDDPGMTFPVTIILRTFVGSLRGLAIPFPSCGFWPKQVKELCSVARELDCILIINTRKII